MKCIHPERHNCIQLSISNMSLMAAPTFAVTHWPPTLKTFSTRTFHTSPHHMAPPQPHKTYINSTLLCTSLGLEVSYLIQQDLLSEVTLWTIYGCHGVWHSQRSYIQGELEGHMWPKACICPSPLVHRISNISCLP